MKFNIRLRIEHDYDIIIVGFLSFLCGWFGSFVLISPVALIKQIIKIINMIF